MENYFYILHHSYTWEVELDRNVMHTLNVKEVLALTTPNAQNCHRKNFFKINDLINFTHEKINAIVDYYTRNGTLSKPFLEIKDLTTEQISNLTFE